MPFKEDGSRKEGPLYKKSGFKMKGNPMQRNFGIGSPLHKDEVEYFSNVEAKQSQVVPSEEELRIYNLEGLYEGDTKLSDERKKEVEQFQSQKKGNINVSSKTDSEGYLQTD